MDVCDSVTLCYIRLGGKGLRQRDLIHKLQNLHQSACASSCRSSDCCRVRFAPIGPDGFICRNQCSPGLLILTPVRSGP